ncbi:MULTISPECIES: hypothetical protein [unclassified Methanoregula]|uniref:hypothetical protein n=1 Tax=unclassified Methanoregula TaxID=2649730 RepID=UPI0009CACF03|nr:MULTISPECIES: hypothetical protein [unclassified Methanoregula]OPX62044.1 MAG: hypothetical protein A4E33_02642 [Methanoregula sp. PtaB.Bin085]OPY36579.1 MAG: hypothetical protein A4E34_00273 [Methanoregula sp. PtaU1.Bin006]
MTTANLNYELPTPEDITWKMSFGKLEIVVIAVIFLQSLLVAWFLFLIAGGLDQSMPLFRVIMGAAIVFAILIPVFILIEGFRYSSILAGFFTPLLLYSLMYPLFNSLLYHINLFLNPATIVPAIVGGLGFGLIGLGAYHMRSGIARSFALVTTGLTIIFLSSPMVLAVFLFVVTGELISIPGFIS